MHAMMGTGGTGTLEAAIDRDHGNEAGGCGLALGALPPSRLRRHLDRDPRREHGHVDVRGRGRVAHDYAHARSADGVAGAGRGDASHVPLRIAGRRARRRPQRTQVAGGPQLYGLLLAAIGGGAIAGAFAIPRLRAKLGADGLVAAGQAGTAVAMALFAFAREPAMAVAASLVAGVCWIAAVSTLNVSTQVALPEWVRARGLAVYVTVMFGAMTIGSAIWGEVASRATLGVANLAAAVGAVAAVALTWRWKLHRGQALDLTPSMYWPEPVVTGTVEDDEGPVMVTIEYRIAREHREAFLAAKGALERQRRRGGGYAWGLFEDTSVPGRFVETFRAESWLEHLRQHDRASAADRALDERVRRYSETPPTATHFIAR
jgi:branched-subunit amino acid transport protein